MIFSQSLEFGNSTLMKLESEVNKAINDENHKDNNALDIILESPTSKSSSKASALSLSRNRSRFLSSATQNYRTENYSNKKFRRSKSDSTLSKAVNQSRQSGLDDYAELLHSDFSFENIGIDKEHIKGNENASVLRVSQIEGEIKNTENVDVQSEVAEFDTHNSFEKPIFSADLRNVFESEGNGNILEDSIHLSVVNQNDYENIDEPLHEISSFICPPKKNDILGEILNKDLEKSRRILREFEQSQKYVLERNISLSGMSPNQLQFTEESSNSVPLTIEVKSNEDNETKCLTNLENNIEIKLNKISRGNLDTLKNIKAWNLPLSVLTEYERKGIKKMFDWQIQCLSNPKVLFEHCNLVYSAPTSAGKTLVSEILLLKTVLEREKKVLVILPFISVVREKMFYLQDLLTGAGYRVEGFFGGYAPPGGFDSINVAICTIEKANAIVNKLLEHKKLNDIGIIVVDEVHLISDPGRGYILELLLAKILYMSHKYGLQIQIVTMSATLANVELLKDWLQAELYITDFRPVALKEMIKIGNKIYDKSLNVLRSVTKTSIDIRDPFPPLQNDSDHVAQLCIETLVDGCSVIVFCPSKDWCENLATQLAGAIHYLSKQGGEWGTKLGSQIHRKAIDNVKQQLRDIPTGLDAVLGKCITYGCSFHHAGLTTEERDIVETNFKSGALKVIVATSTLSSGVNLPARRVIIRTPLFGGKPMSSLTYRQMIGRAGRTGKDILGESILICTESNARVGKDLINSHLKPLRSCLDHDSNTHLKRALLEVISSGVATSAEDINNFVKCTLWSAQKKLRVLEKEHNEQETSHSENVGGVLNFLIEYEFIRLQKNAETGEQHFVATRLGNACLASSMPPTDGLLLFAELQKSRRCFVLESELHAVYLVTPYSVSYQLQDLDWLLFLDLWEKLPPAMKKVGELVGVKESFLVRAMRGQTKLDYKLLQIHKRFYTSLALQELVNETPINVVAIKYKCTRGMLQSLQQMASTFAGIVTSFCNALQWDTLSLIVSQFKERLYFGIHRDLIDLMRLPDLNHKRARILFDAGITSLVELANANSLCIEKILYNGFGFESVKKHDAENEIEAARRNEARNFIITGKTGVSLNEAAKILVVEARKFIQYEIGVGNIKWSQSVSKNGDPNTEVNQLHMSYEENKFQNDITEHNLNHSRNNVDEVAILNESPKDVKTPLDKKIDVYKDIPTNREPIASKIESPKIKNPHDGGINVNSIQSTENADQTLLQKTTDKSERSQTYREKNIDHTKQLSSKVSNHEINTNFKDDPKICSDNKTCGVAPIKRKSLENLIVYSDVPLTNTKKPIDKIDTKSKLNINELTEPRNNIPIDTQDTASTSKKAQRLLRAKQLSDIKKVEWAKKNDMQQTQFENTSDTKPTTLNTKLQTNNIDENLKSSKSEKNILSEDCSLNSAKSIFMEGNGVTPKLLRRSPRNHRNTSNAIKEPNKINKSSNNVKSCNNELFENEESFTINTGIKEVLREVENFKENDFSKLRKRNSSPDEIPSSQQNIARKVTTPTSSRFLRSLRTTRSVECPTTKSVTEITELPKSYNAVNVLEPPSSTSVEELSDISIENSLMKNPIQLNASHILSCSELDTDSSSFKSLDIINICGNLQLFKGAFKEIMTHQRLGFCLGIQKQCGKRKPLIGSNLLLNQCTASEGENEQIKSYEFQIDDASYLAGIAFCLSDNVVYYMNMQAEGSCKELSADMKCKYLHMLLRSINHTLLAYEAKQQMKTLRKVLQGVEEILIAIEDPKVANWLLQPDKNLNLHYLAQQFAPECSSLVNLCGSGRGYNSYGLDADSAILAKVRSSIEACVTIHILKGQIENLERIGSGHLQKFFIELEMPLQMSLCNMEVIGFPTNSEALHKLFQQMIDSMKKLETIIYEIHGSRFNLGSSSAVARVLGLHRKSNGRISTSKQILEKIDSPISQMIIIYRKLSTTLTKTIQPLLKCVNDERIHGDSITFTSTGRISMSEPNLQNVAKNFEVVMNSERKTISCRSAFFSTDSKCCLISADFCQLEMRILAHLSQDPALLYVMKSDKDLFAAIAARWNKIPENSVTEELRNGTKQICYGIVYGMGVHALAESLKCTEEEAKIVLQQFHAAYPGIRSYIDKVVKFARSNGYVETITSRRRYLENICSEEGVIKS